jgi:hypothetical protein
MGIGVSTLASGAAHVVCTNTAVSATMSNSIEPRIARAVRPNCGAVTPVDGVTDGAAG